MLLLLALTFGMVYLDASEHYKKRPRYPYPPALYENLASAREKKLSHVKCHENLCSFTARVNAGDMYIHWAEKHGDLLFFKCKYCNETFLSSRMKYRHEYRKHKKTSQEELYQQLWQEILNTPKESFTDVPMITYYTMVTRRFTLDQIPEDVNKNIQQN